MTDNEARAALCRMADAFAKELGYGKRLTWHEGVRYYLDDLNPNNIIWIRPDHVDRPASEHILEIRHDGISAMLSVKKTDAGWAAGRMQAEGWQGFVMLATMLSRLNGSGQETEEMDR